MSNAKQNLGFERSSLDTLAERGTQHSDKYNSENVHRLIGNGTSKESMVKRPTKKLIDQSTALALVDVAKANGDTKMIQKYWNTWHCFNRIKTDGKKAYGSYCKNRICSVCNANRKAKMINQYKPIIEKWKKPYFVTLTRKTVNKYLLLATIKDNDAKFERIVNRIQKRHQRGKGPKFIALRSKECNFNPLTSKYNPHYHLLVPDWTTAKLLIDEWLIEQNKGLPKDSKSLIANNAGQDITKVTDLNHHLVEIIKYSTKIMTDPDMKKGKNKTKLPIIYAAALHEIHKALGETNVISKYGFKLLQSEYEAKEKTVSDHQVKCWSYKPTERQYIEESTAEVMYMEKHLPKPEIEYLVSERIDKESN